MRLNLRPQLLEVLHDGPVNGTAQVRMLVGNRTRLVADAVEDVLIARAQNIPQQPYQQEQGLLTHLEPALTQELVARPEGDLDDPRELGHLAGDIVLDVGYALEVGDELLDDGLPGGEAFDEDVRGAEVVGGDVLLDEGLAAGDGGAAPAGLAGEGGCAGDGDGLVHGGGRRGVEEGGRWGWEHFMCHLQEPSTSLEPPIGACLRLTSPSILDSSATWQP